MKVVSIQGRIATLRQRRIALTDELADVNRQLNAQRVKCPTCRCRILPGDVCTCCAMDHCDDEPYI
jgi:hypothetical protein